MSQEYLRWYGERQTHSDPHQAKLAREAYANQMQYLEQKYTLIEYALKAGIRLAAGTDSFIGDVRFDALPDEIRYLVEYGCTPMQGLQTATLWEAQAMGWNDLGSLQTGMCRCYSRRWQSNNRYSRVKQGDVSGTRRRNCV